MNIAILLAAGASSRFNSKIHKVLYKINNKPIIKYSTDILCEYLDKIIIVANSTNDKPIHKIFAKNKKVQLVINNIDTRLDSIKAGLDSIKPTENISNLLIHDAARPHITPQMIETLLVSSEQYQFNQYCLVLNNGLVQKTTAGYDTVDRAKYLELCTPQITEYHLFNFLFRKYIYPNNRLSCEILPLLNKFNIQHNLIEGNARHLHKITTLEDIQ